MYIYVPVYIYVYIFISNYENIFTFPFFIYTVWVLYTLFSTFEIIPE